MRWLSCLALSAAMLWLAACDNSARGETLREPPQERIETPVRPAPPPLAPAVSAQVNHLLTISANSRLTPLVREAEGTQGFQSNFGGQSHRRYWWLLRRVGIDPTTKLQGLFESPYGVKQIGYERWFIWPDFAARAPEDLIPERLNFQDRARLIETIGEDGIARIRAGEPYPGARTAISESGRWVYFILNAETGEETE